MEVNDSEKAIDFSVIIPAFNAGQFITRTLDSVANQTHSNFEIVITNDGSVDNTETVITEYIRAHPSLQIHLSYQANKGIGSARNNGIFRARGTYLAFLDADDCWYPNKLEKVHEARLKFPDKDILYHDEVEVRIDGTRRILNYSMLEDPAYDDLLFNGNRLSTSATVVKRELGQKLNGFSQNLDFNSAEDYDFWLRLAKDNAKFYHLPIVLGEYNRIADSVSKKIMYHATNSFNVIKNHVNIMMVENRHDKHFLQKILDNLKSQNFFNIARAFFLEKNYKKSSHYYLKARKERFFWWKPYAGLIQCLIFVCTDRFPTRFKNVTSLKGQK